MSSITGESIALILTLLFAYLGWRASAIPNDTDRIRNIRERFGNTVGSTSFYHYQLLRIQVVEREGFLMKAAKYIPPFLYQGLTMVYLRFQSFENDEFPKIASLEQIIDHPDYNKEYHIARIIQNDHRDLSIDVILTIETGDPKRVHGSIQHFSGLLITLGEQKSHPEEYYDPDYGWDMAKGINEGVNEDK